MSALAATIASPLPIRGDGVRVAWWLRSILSLLVAVAILAVALPVAFGSGARGAGVDPVQVFSSGSLLTAETSGGAQLSVDGMVPGQSRSATIRVSNTGSEAAVLSLEGQIADRATPGPAPLSGAMTLRVESASSGAVLYSGPIGRMPRLGLGSTPAGGERSYRFTVALPQGVGNEVEGSSLSAGFAWNAA